MKYIISDMDGTLLNDRKEISPYAFEILTQLKDMDIHFGIASGRQYYNLRKYFSTDAEDMIFICENGAMIFHGNERLYADVIAYEKLIQPVTRIRTLTDAYPVLCGVQAAYIEDKDEDFIRNVHMYYDHLEIVDDLLEAAKQDDICKIAIFDKHDTSTHSFSYMEGYVEGQHMVVSGKDWVDITNPGVNKGKAIRFLKDVHGIKDEDIMVFGDFMNDYEMMLECSNSYAMANAHPKVKEVSKHIALSNEEDGVMKAICDVYGIVYPLHSK